MENSQSSFEAQDQPKANSTFCRDCGLADCARDYQERIIIVKPIGGYRLICCGNQAEALQATEDRRAKGVHAEDVIAMMRLSGIPARFSESTFENFTFDSGNVEALTLCQQFAENFDNRVKSGRGLVVVGPPGVGKTHLGVAILRSLIEQGTPSRYLYAPDLLELLRRRFTSQQPPIGNLEEGALCDIKCLFLDDIGLDPDTGWTVSFFSRIIDGRYRNLHPTIFASNLGLLDLEKAIGERSMSRLIESNDIVQIHGKDRRVEP